MLDRSWLSSSIRRSSNGGTSHPRSFLCAVRWYLRYSLSYREVQELLTERGLEIDHTTVWRWVQRYAPELEERTRPHLNSAKAPLQVPKTASPALNWVTRLPIATTSPATSTPGRRLLRRQSSGLTEAARVFMRTSLSFGMGVSISVIRRTFP